MAKRNPNAKTIDAVAVEVAEKPAEKPAENLPAKRSPSSAPAAAPAPTPGAAAIVDTMARLAADPNVDVEKLRALVDLQERVMDRQAKADFDAAFARMQPELPVIDRKGRIIVREKDRNGQRTGPVTQDTRYARFEDINEVVTPILGRHGFGVRFKTGLTPDGKIWVIGVLSGHGHREEAEFILPHDSTGSKNAVQAIGSSTQYGKRYALCALLNITTRGMDDDGVKGGEAAGPVRVSEEQAEQIVDLCRRVDCSAERLLKYVNGENRPAGHPEVTEVAGIPASRFEEVINGLNKIGKASKKAAAGTREEGAAAR